MPVVGDRADQEVLALIWASIPKGNINQYTQKDLEYMSRFSNLVKNYLQNRGEAAKDLSLDLSMADCIKNYEKLSVKMQRDQQYFASIIHDIRTPMSGVIGFLELLKQNETNAQKKEYIETALQSAEDMIVLINDALDIAKLSSGKMSIEKSSFSPFEELGDVAKLFYNSAKEKGIVLDVYYDPKIPRVIQSDYHRIKQIANNLLNNAIKFTPQGGYIFLELLYDKQIDGLTVSVKDTGIGIAKERQKDIFSPYSQEKSSTAREYGGTGLGLSISQQLSVLLGGKMELESEEGKGSRFYFTIPCNTPKNTPSLADDQSLKGRTVCLYDSEKRHTTMKSVARYMKAFHVSVKRTNPNQSLKNLIGKHFDLLIISEEDTRMHEEEIELILDSGIAVIIMEEMKLEEEHNWYAGNIKRLRMPLLPHTFYSAMQHVLMMEGAQETEKLANKLEKLKGKQILVVDDNQINLKLMKEILKSYKIDVLLVNSGEKAIEYFKEQKMDMVFVDRRMPNMQGSELIEIIREMERQKRQKPVAIIALTGDTDKRSKEELFRVGADEVLTKPLQVKELDRVLYGYLGS